MGRRWSDNEYQWGPFTFSKMGQWKPLGIVVRSGDGDEDLGCRVQLFARWFTLICELPPVIRPYVQRVKATYWSAETIERLGRDWYEEKYTREYGFMCSDGHLSVYYGAQADGDIGEKRWGCFLPWTKWRHVRHSLYDTAGSSVWTKVPHEGALGLGGTQSAFDARERCPAVTFLFEDYDGERITARCVIEEREWRFGTGWFKWLSWFRYPRIRRSLDLEFSAQVGPEKGSWKGGTLGHRIEMKQDEMHESAFRRYCNQHNLTFLKLLWDGPVDGPYPQPEIR